MSSRLSVIDSSISSRNFPAAPINGTPFRSSFFPGASPINTMSASMLPSPNTSWVACLARSGQTLFFKISALIRSSSVCLLAAIFKYCGEQFYAENEQNDDSEVLPVAAGCQCSQYQHISQ